MGTSCRIPVSCGSPVRCMTTGMPHSLPRSIPRSGSRRTRPDSPCCSPCWRSHSRSRPPGTWPGSCSPRSPGHIPPWSDPVGGCFMLWLAGFFFLVCRSIAQKLLKGGGKSGAGGGSGGKSATGGGGQKSKKATRLIPFGFLLLAVAALVYAPLPFGWGSVGSILASLTEWALGLPAALFGVPVATIAAVLLALVLVLGLIDL